MTYEELAAKARGTMGPVCRACPVCNGRACGSQIPGPGAKGSGNVSQRNYEAWKDYRLLMDTIHEGYTASAETKVLGRRLAMPVMVAPIGDVTRHYGDRFDTATYNRLMLRGAREAGTLGWTGDGLGADLGKESFDIIDELEGCGIVTIKPWSMDRVDALVDEAIAVRPAAIAMDVDAAGLPFLRGQQPPAGAKKTSELREVAHRCHASGVPFVVKGIMTEQGAAKAIRAHADAIVVSNHGGRVLDGVPSTAEVLPDIVNAVGRDVEVLVDGGIRSGIDVFRALALGARAVLMCRPFVVATFGGGSDGVRDYLTQLAGELVDAMEMCGAERVRDITSDMLW